MIANVAAVAVAAMRMLLSLGMVPMPVVLLPAADPPAAFVSVRACSDLTQSSPDLASWGKYRPRTDQ